MGKAIIPLHPANQTAQVMGRVENPNGKRFHIWTIGCQMNEADSAKVAAMLQEVGYAPTETELDADVIVLNSCVVRQAAEDKVAGKLGSLARIKRDRPDVQIVLTGCMVTKQQEQLKTRFPHVDLFFDPSDFDKLQILIPELSDLHDDLGQIPHYYLPEAGDSRVSAYVPIIYGCNFLCSYCIVPYRRGKERSRPLADIVLEVEGLVRQGVKDVTLLGQTVNAYGHDLPEETTLAALLRAVDAIPGLDRLRFLTSHPKYMTDELIDTMAGLPSICEHLNLPVQAGDNEVLKRMRRTYTADLWRDRIAYARSKMPGLTVATDIIVGFPGERADQFQNTLDLLEEVGCDKVHVAMYSPRPGTLSARWEDDIPHDEKHRRHQAVEKLQERILTERNSHRVGEVYEVLIDTQQKGRWTGRTRGNLLVHVDSHLNLLGRNVPVRITESSPWYLIGTVDGAAV
ncbi:MAG TPA: tRNA (N6-isopentenyl adenosine(37)-C2)-methylthiotransferase MiaB [Thermomicrobiales bacterium]|nr:tRNA (N6-isopentenyl adenosine(37)-C2)-methylthiotransferase MiaB [Thermomicrobiales bacterium]